MREELDQALCRDFPILYRDRNGSLRETCMAYGFCCGDGWYHIIRWLSEKLEPAIAALPEEERPCAFQVKEKFGTLRYYMSSETDEMTKWIAMAEHLSADTCEECGAEGKLRPGGWIQTLCDGCHEKRS